MRESDAQREEGICHIVICVSMPYNITLDYAVAISMRMMTRHNHAVMMIDNMAQRSVLVEIDAMMLLTMVSYVRQLMVNYLYAYTPINACIMHPAQLTLWA